MKINLPSASLCCMSRFYLWPLTSLKASAAAGCLARWPCARPLGSFLLKPSLPAGPGAVTMSVSPRDRSFDLAEENGFVPGKLAAHGKHASRVEIWKRWGKAPRWGLACHGGLPASVRSGRPAAEVGSFSLPPFPRGLGTWLPRRPAPACPLPSPSPSPAEVSPRRQRQAPAA